MDSLKKQFAIEWVAALSALMIVFMLLAYFFYSDRKNRTELEKNRVYTQIKILSDNLNREMHSIALSQRNISNEIAYGKQTQKNPMPFVRKRMQGFVDIIHTVRSMTLVDASGLILYSTEAAVIGKSASKREHITELRDSDFDLDISKPFTTSTDIWTINVSTKLKNSDGSFDGVVISTLEPDKITDMLESVLYDDDMWSALAHNSNIIFLSTQNYDGMLGKDLAVSSSFYNQHIKSGNRISVFSGKVYANNQDAIIAVSTIKPEVPSNDNLVVAIAKDLKSIYAPWYKNLLTSGAIYLILTIMGTLALYQLQVRKLRAVKQEEEFRESLIQKNKKLKEQSDYMESLALLDGLTGIANRRRFDDLFQKFFLSAKREKTALSVVMMDIDHFKKYNDHYGHQAGDECLKAVAQAIAGCVNRPLDLVARYGGEEFVAILSNTSREGAVIIADKFRKAVESLQMEHVKSETSNVVTVSLGVADLTGDIETCADLLKNADDALYNAKKNGRNRVYAHS